MNVYKILKKKVWNIICLSDESYMHEFHIKYEYVQKYIKRAFTNIICHWKIGFQCGYIMMVWVVWKRAFLIWWVHLCHLIRISYSFLKIMILIWIGKKKLHIKKVVCYRAKKKIFQKSFFFFGLKAFLQHKIQEPNKIIFDCD